MIERTGPLVFSGRFVTYGVRLCETIAEAREALPDLTQEHFDAIKAGDAIFVGDSRTGLSYRDGRAILDAAEAVLGRVSR